MTPVAARSPRHVISSGRKILNTTMLGLCVLGTIFTLGLLALIFGYVVVQGARHVSLAFFTNLPTPVGTPGGGFLNALVGTAIMVGVASAMSIPVGIFSGIYLSEFGGKRLARSVRFVNDTLGATPSIVAGLFAYTLIVVPAHRFSAFAGSVALAVLMIPTITRTTEQMLRLVPHTLREAALAVGVPEWRMTLQIVLPSAGSGIVTGIMLAVARVSGETAALLFTAFNSRFLSVDLNQPMSSVSVQVYTYAIAPYRDWHDQAWAGALVLVTLVALFSAAVRIATKGRHRAV
jgi:phosphate transport system permease protein